MDITSRTQAAMILGAKLFICPFGKELASQTANADFCPDPPTSYADPGDWTPLGKIANCKPNTDYQSNDLKDVDDNGVYVTTTLKLAAKRQLQFTTHDIPPEAIQMTFGLMEAIENGTEQALFASGNDSIECWLYLELTDAYRAKCNIAHMFMCGKLSLQNPLEAKSDPAQADFQLDMMSNPLSTFTPVAVANAPTASSTPASQE